MNELIKLSDYIHWKNRREYSHLIQNFLNSTISVNEFTNKFHELHLSNEKTIEKIEKDPIQLQLAISQINPESLEFSRWIGELDMFSTEYCDHSVYGFTKEEVEEAINLQTEEQLRDIIRYLLFPEIQKYS